MSTHDLDFTIELFTVNADPASLVPFIVHTSGVRRRASIEEVALWDALREARRQLAELQEQQQVKKPARR